MERARWRGSWLFIYTEKVWNMRLKWVLISLKLFIVCCWVGMKKYPFYDIFIFNYKSCGGVRGNDAVLLMFQGNFYWTAVTKSMSFKSISSFVFTPNLTSTVVTSCHAPHIIQERIVKRQNFLTKSFIYFLFKSPPRHLTHKETRNCTINNNDDKWKENTR